MTATIESHQHGPDTYARRSLAGPAFVLGGIAFFIGGMTHPTDSGDENRILELHEMLLDPGWYPSHALLLVAMVLFTVGILAIRRRPELTSNVRTVLTYAFAMTCLATVSMTVHLFAAVGADSLADGEPSLTSRVQTVNETVVQAPWALAIAALAVVGGQSRTVGHRLTIPFGVVGGLAFAIASATIPFTDTFDPLFKLGSLLAVWAVLVGVTAIRQHPREGFTQENDR